VALGRCQFMTCQSLLGTKFRAPIVFGGRQVDMEVLLCPTHERECDELRRKFPGRIGMTPEGSVYSGIWIDSLGFLAK
jgi:hypothetical protein